MTARKYTKTSEAAGDIGELIIYLKSIHNCDFVYRGQIEEYSGPLLPSYYRAFLGSGDKKIDIDQTANNESIESLRRCGRSFYGEYNEKFLDWLQRKNTNTLSLSKAQAELLYTKVISSKAARNYQIKKLVVDHEQVSWFNALIKTSSPSEKKLIEKNYPIWKPYVNSYHKRMIRMEGFYKPFGFVVGNALAQQYGLSSMCLDVTTSIEVASFFACYDSKSNYEKINANGIGIIYRIPYDRKDTYLNFLLTDYYSAPSVMDISALLTKLQQSGLDEDVYFDAFKKNYEDMYIRRTDFKKSFRLPENCVLRTRIGKQQAGLIIPDEIREDIGAPQVDGIRKPNYQYIEDISKRPGIEKFYFRHTPLNCRYISITKEELWPRDDILLKTITAVITAIYPIHEFGIDIFVPRLDLLNGGYDNEAFIEELTSAGIHDPILCINKLKEICSNPVNTQKLKHQLIDAYLEMKSESLIFSCVVCLSSVILSGESLRTLKDTLALGTLSAVRCIKCGTMYLVQKNTNGYHVQPL